MVGLLRGLVVLIFLILIAGVIVVGYYRDMDLPPELVDGQYRNAASRFIDLPSGAHMHYRDQGRRSGPPLLLLHGSNASLHTWEPWVVELGDAFRVITIDLPGHGLTGPVPGDDYSGEGMAKFVDQAMTALHVQHFALGGNSMGGAIAARYALLHPDRVTHLILIDAGGIPSKTPTDPGLGFTLARYPIVRNVMLLITPRALIEEGLKKAIYDDRLVTSEMIDRVWRLNLRAGTRAATLKRFQTPWDDFVQNNVSKITTPTLILWGAQDTLVPPDVGLAYADAIKHAKLIVYKDVGHLPMEEIPEQSARAVREFLAPSAAPVEPEVLPVSASTPP